MFLLQTGHQPGVYVPLRALFLVVFEIVYLWERIGVIRQGGFIGPLLFSSFDKPIRSISKYYVIC